MRTYNSIQEIKDHNKELGFHFFSRDTMRFFKSRVQSAVIKGVYFITSETNPSGETMYSVRICLNGEIDTIGPFHSFETKKEAKELIKSLPKYFPEAYKTAVDEFNGKRKKNETSFVDYALTEPMNNRDGSFDPTTFVGACTWIIKNWEVLDHAFLKYFVEKYNEKLNEE